MENTNRIKPIVSVYFACTHTGQYAIIVTRSYEDSLIPEQKQLLFVASMKKGSSIYFQKAIHYQQDI